jgi:hypothetical protein
VRGRIRTIKPDIGKHEELWDLGQSTGLPVYQAFTLLWCYADREGRFEWRPRSLKTDILPYWDGDFSRVLDALATRGFIVKYACGDREFGVIPTFSKHQVVNHRESPSELPEPNDSNILTRDARVDDACTVSPGSAHGEGNGKGREGNGMGETTRAAPAKPKNPRPKAERFVPESWQPNDAHREKAGELRILIDRELQSFRCHEFRTPKSDWDRAFHAWLTRSAQFGTSSGGGKGRYAGGFSERQTSVGAIDYDLYK